MPSSRSWVRAPLMASRSSTSSGRRAKTCSLVSPVLAATLTSWSPVVLKYCSAARLSLTVASTRCCLTSVTAWVKPSTASTLAPALVATWAQLLVALCAVVLPWRSDSWVIELSSVRVMITPSETVYGADSAYLPSRSAFLVTWLATTSKRSESRLANSASKGASTNSGRAPSLPATAVITSMS